VILKNFSEIARQIPAKTCKIRNPCATKNRQILPQNRQKLNSATATKTTEGTPMSLKAEKGSKQRSRDRCKAQTKAGGLCPAPAVERGLCFFHAHPEKLATLGRQGGQRNRRWKDDELDLPQRPLKNIGDVSELLEETINRVRQGPFDLRAANAIGFLAGILLKALDQRLEERLAHLEAVVSGKRGTDTEAFEFRAAKESTQ
jgi:hypothetical protein